MDALGLQFHTDDSLKDCVRRMYENHLDTGDVIFRVGKDGSEVRVHRFMLMCRSKVFFSMFTGQGTPGKPLRIPNIRRAAFLQFVEFLYTDYTHVTAENFGDLFCCAKKYKIDFLSILCKNSLKNFIRTDIVCQMMEFAKLYDDPDLVDICLKAVEIHMPSFLYSEMFLKMCTSCIYEITQQENILAPEEVIFARVLIWSEEECIRQELPVTAENQRNVLGDILYEIRFPLMDHQYLEDVVCGSKLLNDGEKVDILRQQLKSKKRNPGRFKIHKRIWQPTEVMTSQFYPTRTMYTNDYVQTGLGYSLGFGVSSPAVLLGIYLNIGSCADVQAQNYDVIASITPLELLGDDTTDTMKDFSTPLSEVKENRIELYPRFFIPLKKGVQYTVSVRFDLKPASMFCGLNTSIMFKEMKQQLSTSVSFNGKTLSVCGWPTSQLIRGLWMA
ncbi:BTB/POZ domain-containing protein 2-like [Ostrea edulis]|uniref:BTB/POZ domain-containing protein 2-like n=1 Tax=Ostrea edulis TaxID=37623 RepID=UPI0024AF9A8C|nr:BTB/POZ domain-containing protein 2-like [Ostrea edulis]